MVLACFSLALLSVGLPFVIALGGQVAYSGGDFTSAQKIWRLTANISWYDQDVPIANAGLAYYQSGHVDQAIDQLEQALKITVPKRNCKIRWNLAVALAQRADERASTQPNDAIGDYARGINVLDDAECKNDPEYRDKFQQLSTALTQKMNALVEQIKEQHKRPTDPQDKNEKDKTTSDDDKAKDQAKRNKDYQHDIYDGRYDQQTDEEKERGYQENAW